MFEPLPELSPDLDWMLESGQASQAMLAEALLEEFYAPVLRLACAILDDQDQAQTAAQEVFVTALLNVYRYRSQEGGGAWLLRIAFPILRRKYLLLVARRGMHALIPGETSRRACGESTPQTGLDADTWLAFDQLPLRLRLALLLVDVLGWKPEVVTAALGMRGSELGTHLASARQEMERQLRQSSIHPAEALDSLQARWTNQEISAQEREALVGAILPEVSGRSGRIRRAVSFKEMTTTAVGVAVVAGLIWGAGQLLPEENPIPTQAPAAAPGQPFRGRFRDNPRIFRTPFSPDRTARPRFTPPVVITPTPLPDYIFYTVESDDTLTSVAAKLGTTIESLQRMNRLADINQLQIGQRLIIPDALDLTAVPQPTPATSIPPHTFPGGMPTSDELLKFIQDREYLQRSMWADAAILDYGPPGYIGPPQIERLQIWRSPNQMLLLSGADGSPPEEILLLTADTSMRAQPVSGWFQAISSAELQQSQAMKYLTDFTRLPDASPAARFDMQFKLTKTDFVGIRPAYVVDQTGEAGQVDTRLWVDQATGVFLRRQEFDPKPSTDPSSGMIVRNTLVRREFVVLQITFDVDLPQELLDARLPWRGGYAHNSSGEPEPADYNVTDTLQHMQLGSWRGYINHLPAAPASFNPAKEALTFQMPADFNPRVSSTAASVVAGKYLLGNISDFGNPWTMICARSPDGLKLAYVSDPTNPALSGAPKNSFLNWVDLRNPHGLQAINPLGGVYVTNFAFSPDSQTLAVFGYDGQVSMGTLFLLDLKSGEYHALLNQGDLKSLVWSPDGKYLAFIGRGIYPQYHDDVMVARVSDGYITYRGSIDIESNATREWPMDHWGADGQGVKFPILMGGLEDCANPIGAAP